MATDAAPLTARQRQARATQERLLNAAFDEFQQHGLAGARVDRIAEKAHANKRLIYVYFGDKEQLFDVVVARNVETMLDAVPFDAENLPDYAERLMQYLEARPGLTRLYNWRGLERTTASATESESYQRKIAQIAKAQRSGVVDPTMPAIHLLAYVLGLVGAWTIASPALRDAGGKDAAQTHRRKSLRTAVQRLVSADATR